MALTQKERSARSYRRRKDNGLCPRCGNKLDREGHYCSKCLEKVNQYNRENRKFMIEQGLCPECRLNTLYGDEHICLECKAKKALYKKPATEKQKQQMKQYSKTTYQQRKENGICTRCGKRKAEDGKVKCRICLNHDAYLHRKREFQKGNINEVKEKNNLCYMCGNKIDVKSGKLCSKCLKRCEENGRKSSGSGNNSYWIAQNKLIFRKF